MTVCIERDFLSRVGRLSAGRSCLDVPSLPTRSGVGEGGVIAAVYLGVVWKLAAA